MSTHTLCRSKLGHVEFAGVSGHFSDSSFPTLSKQTLSFINVASFHLALVGDLKSKAIFLFLHSFLHPHLLSLHRKKFSFLRLGKPNLVRRVTEKKGKWIWRLSKESQEEYWRLILHTFKIDLPRQRCRRRGSWTSFNSSIEAFDYLGVSGTDESDSSEASDSGKEEEEEEYLGPDHPQNDEDIDAYGHCSPWVSRLQTCNFFVFMFLCKQAIIGLRFVSYFMFIVFFFIYIFIYYLL